MQMHCYRQIALGLYVLLALLALACSKPEATPPRATAATQVEYFPLALGKYVEYQVDSTVYDFGPGGSSVVLNHTVLVREIVEDTLRDNTGQLGYQIGRYERPDAQAPWEYKQTFGAQRTATQAIRTENNFRFLKMVFPMDKRSFWNGNLWIDVEREIEIAGERMRPFSNWAYAVDSIDVPAQVGVFAFDSTLLITEADDTNLFEKRFSRARYAKNIGLVWREQWILDSQYCNQAPVPLDCETKPWELKAEKGYILRQWVIGYQ